KRVSRFRQGDPTGAPFQQGRSHPMFNSLNAFAQCRLGNAKVSRRLGKTAMLDDHDERSQILEYQSHSPQRSSGADMGVVSRPAIACGEWYYAGWDGTVLREGANAKGADTILPLGAAASHRSNGSRRLRHDQASAVAFSSISAEEIAARTLL